MRRLIVALLLLAWGGCSKSDSGPAAPPASTEAAPVQPAPVGSGAPAAAARADGVRDPVCGKRIENPSSMPREEIDGVLYYFCSEACEERAKASPPARGSGARAR
jgi:YHS domain-containing protein